MPHTTHTYSLSCLIACCFESRFIYWLCCFALRSLAWIVREKKGFVKPYCVPFLEFVWADFLRANLCILKGEEGERPTFTTPTRSSVLTKRGKGSNKLYRHVQQHEVTMGDDGETAGEKVTVGPEELANMVSCEFNCHGCHCSSSSCCC